MQFRRCPDFLYYLKPSLFALLPSCRLACANLVSSYEIPKLVFGYLAAGAVVYGCLDELLGLSRSSHRLKTQFRPKGSGTLHCSDIYANVLFFDASTENFYTTILSNRLRWCEHSYASTHRYVGCLQMAHRQFVVK